MGKPWTPDSLAERWDCSAETIRSMCRTGRLPSFRVGTQYRIRAEVVEDYECQSQESGVSTDDSSSHGSMPKERGGATDCKLTRAKPQRRKPETFFDGKAPGPLVI